MKENPVTDRTPEELQDAARQYITDYLATGKPVATIDQPAELWAECRRVLGPRVTVFSTAGWSWVNETFEVARDKAQA